MKFAVGRLSVGENQLVGSAEHTIVRLSPLMDVKSIRN